MIVPRPHTLHRLFALFALTLVYGCDPLPLGQTERPVLGGEPHEGHPYVGYIKPEYGLGICTGVLIAPRWVLTAGHCVADIDWNAVEDTSPGTKLPHVVWTERAFCLEGQYNPTTGVAEGDCFAARAVHVHPDFAIVAETGRVSHQFDMALVELERDAAFSTALLSTDAPVNQEPVVLVGYGLSGEAPGDHGLKRIGTSEISLVIGQYIWLNGSDNICRGDSGGALLATRDGREELIGVLTNGNCAKPALGYARRVDVPIYRDWIAPLIAGVGPSPDADALGFIGDPCATEDGCDSGQCLTEAEDSYPGGMCTERCEKYCPDRAGSALTFCIPMETEHGVEGLCVSRCDFALHAQGCRDGYSCTVDPLPRFSDPDTAHRVCLPEAMTPKADQVGLTPSQRASWEEGAAGGGCGLGGRSRSASRFAGLAVLLPLIAVWWGARQYRPRARRQRR